MQDIGISAKLTRRELICAAAIGMLDVQFAFAKPRAPSRIALINGVPTLIVDGAPLLVAGAQCDIWRSTPQNAATVAFFDRYRQLNATTVSVGIPWSKVELSPDVYDFSFVDRFIHEAQIRGLKLVLNLFNTNICGKILESGGNPYYPPRYIIDSPDQYQRMVLTSEYKYDAGGPPMCPNDPRTLDRERRYVTALTAHLRDYDRDRTVVLLQLDNEFYYMQWTGSQPTSDERLSIRCLCRFCNEKWTKGSYPTSRDFMFQSFADYAKALSDAMHETYPVPIYLNDPWWPEMAVPIFLDTCPNIAMIGMDGVFDPQEPNQLSRAQIGRNLAFAAENPTEQPKTRFNLDVLPYYTLIGHLGIGNLLWECGPPHTVIDDPDAARRYGAALYPIKHAQSVIAYARGTDRLGGWYALRDFDGQRPTQMFVREGTRTRIAEGASVSLSVQDLTIDVENSLAGIVAIRPEGDVVIATSAARLRISGRSFKSASTGKFVGGSWLKDAPVDFSADGAVLDLPGPVVVLLML